MRPYRLPKAGLSKGKKHEETSIGVEKRREHRPRKTNNKHNTKKRKPFLIKWKKKLLGDRELHG